MIFDGEWSIFEQKTVRLVWQDAASGRLRRSDVMFSGSAVQIPAVYDTDLLLIGVYAGDIRTTTPARIPCCGCITDSASQHPDLPEDVYAQLMRLIEKLTAVGFGAASDATMIYDGVNAGFVGKTEEVEE